MDKDIDINSISAGSIKAFETLYLAYFTKVLTFTSILLRDPVKAEDATQDVFLKLWRNRAGMKADGQIDSYIYVTAKRTVLDIFREENYILKHKDWAMSHITEETFQDQCMKEIESIAADVVDCMPPRRKEIFLLSRRDGLQAREIADKLGLSVHTVNKHIALALSMLKGRLKDYMPLLLFILTMTGYGRI